MKKTSQVQFKKLIITKSWKCRQFFPFENYNKGLEEEKVNNTSTMQL